MAHTRLCQDDSCLPAQSSQVRALALTRLAPAPMTARRVSVVGRSLSQLELVEPHEAQRRSQEEARRHTRYSAEDPQRKLSVQMSSRPWLAPLMQAQRGEDAWEKRARDLEAVNHQLKERLPQLEQQLAASEAARTQAETRASSLEATVQELTLRLDTLKAEHAEQVRLAATPTKAPTRRTLLSSMFGASPRSAPKSTNARGGGEVASTPASCQRV